MELIQKPCEAVCNHSNSRSLHRAVCIKPIAKGKHSDGKREKKKRAQESNFGPGKEIVLPRSRKYPILISKAGTQAI
eukprot:1159554-Pelagomonas_calceolata.AAC.8